MILAVSATPGGSPWVVCDAQTDVTELHVSGGRIYWTSPGLGYLMNVPTSGGTAAAFVANQHAPADMVIDGTSAYWVNRDDGKVRSADITGKNIMTVASGMGTLVTVDTDGASLFMANDQGEIWRMSADGTDPTLLADGQVRPDDITLVGDWVYWINCGQSDVVKRVAK